MDNVTERSVPRSTEAESSVLGSLLRDNSTIHVVARTLKPEHFYNGQNRMVYRAIIDLYEQSGTVDLVILEDLMRRRGEIDKCGGPEYLVTLEESGTPAHVEYYARIVKDRAFMRHLVSVCSEVQDTLCESAKPANELRDWAESHLFDAFRHWESGDAVRIGDLVAGQMKKIEELHESHGAMSGIPTQFPRMDELLCGLQQSQLVIIAGRPSMGKTSFALNIVENVGVTQKIPVHLFSLETSREQITMNMLCAHARVDAQMVRRGMMRDQMLAKLTQSADAIYGAPVYIDDTPGLSVLDLKAKARQMKEKAGTRMIVIDYMQLMSSPGRSRSESREQEISFISRSLKALARELEVSVIALAQVNRSVEQREDHRPRLSDLRESGAIEQDADVIIFLHRPWYYDRSNEDEDKKRRAEAIIAKQRNGPTGTVNLVFQANYMKFETMSEENEPDEAFPLEF